MTLLRERMLEDLRIRGRSKNTQKSYVERITQFARHFGQSPDQLGPEQIRAYQVYLLEYKGVSISHLNQFVAAARFLYGTTLEKDWAIKKIPHPKRPKKLPEVLSEEEVKQLLESIFNVKHHAIMTTIYGTGVRVSEACQLAVRDIDSKRMVIRIRQAKGAKDRYVPLPSFVLETLRAYWEQLRPDIVLFPGRRRDRPIATRHVATVCVNAARAAGILKHTTPHCLRHTFATHMLERGANILDVQAILGHVSLKTTSRYLHVSSKGIATAPSPLDAIMNPSGQEKQA